MRPPSNDKIDAVQRPPEVDRRSIAAVTQGMGVCMTNNAEFIERYRRTHQHPANRALHAVGIPTIVVSLPLFFWNWPLALGLFAVGWVLQFLGHAFEGKAPAFFADPRFLLVGPWWWLRKTLGLEKR